jgi:hypothetical protein
MSDVQCNLLDVRDSILIPITVKDQVKTWPLIIVEKFDGI